MVLALPVALGLVLALLFGGDPRRLSTLAVRRVELFYVAIAVQLAAFPLSFMPWHMSDGAGRVLWLVSYAVLCAGALLNLRITGVPVVAAGMVSNIVAVAANGGHMPALPQALRAAGKSYVVQENSIAMASPHLPWLVDRWAVPGWLPGGNVFSVGDVVIAIGTLVLVVAAAQARVSLPLARRAAQSGG